jgi:hypothetical protein
MSHLLIYPFRCSLEVPPHTEIYRCCIVLFRIPHQHFTRGGRTLAHCSQFRRDPALFDRGMTPLHWMGATELKPKLWARSPGTITNRYTKWVTLIWRPTSVGNNVQSLVVATGHVQGLYPFRLLLCHPMSMYLRSHETSAWRCCALCLREKPSSWPSQIVAARTGVLGPDGPGWL